MRLVWGLLAFFFQVFLFLLGLFFFFWLLSLVGWGKIKSGRPAASGGWRFAGFCLLGVLGEQAWCYGC
jgi:hypothetical protein